jgi:hypothetical protein
MRSDLRLRSMGMMETTLWPRSDKPAEFIQWVMSAFNHPNIRVRHNELSPGIEVVCILIAEEVEKVPRQE